MNELRCGNCRSWLGEAVEVMVHVEHVEKGTESVRALAISPPRDLRLCKSCERVNVFVPKASLAVRAS
jgi:hypothetical protein